MTGLIPFQPTLLVRGATLVSATTSIIEQFQSTLLVRGATPQILADFLAKQISIHAPRERSDFY